MERARASLQLQPSPTATPSTTAEGQIPVLDPERRGSSASAVVGYNRGH